MRILRAAALVAGAAMLAACGSTQTPIADGDAVEGGGGAINLAQGWSRQTQDAAWFAPFGSRLIPTAWLKVLERPGSNERFMNDAHLDALGFLTQAPTPNNPNGFPIGFTREADAKGQEWTGLGCSACHTGEVRYKNQRIRLDGGQGMLDFVGFEGEIVDSLKATTADAAKFDRFAAALNVAADQRDALQAQVRTLADKVATRHAINASDVAYGHGRLDAFGQIFNAVAVQFLGIAGNRRSPNAPVSYPVLWGAPHLDLVQWNGSAPNAGPGPLLQNVTTALAVYGSLDVSEDKGLDGYPSSIDFVHLGQIQDYFYALQPPRWPAWVFGPLDVARAERGAHIYAQQCASCHTLSDRDNPTRELKVVLTPLAEVGTDPRMARNFLEATADTGVFAGRKEGVVFGKPLAAQAPTADVVVHAAVGAALRHPLEAARDAVKGYHKVLKTALDSRPDAYKARPLSGIWASAPYLHNGSVPSLVELLKPPAERTARFFVGSREYDPLNVGVAVGVAEHASEFDTTLAGNSNAGHVYGTTLVDGDKRDLLEYLKTL